MEIDSGAAFVLGVHDSTLIFVQKYNLTTLELMVQKILRPSNTSLLQTYEHAFKSIGVADDKLYAYYGMTDVESIIMLNATTLSVIKHWEAILASIALSNNRIWMADEPNA